MGNWKNLAAFIGGLLFAGCLCGMPAQAADLSLKDTQGRVLHLSDYRGKWVLVNFWATWCPSCMSEIPDLVSLNEAHKNQDLVVISVVMDYNSKDEVTKFAAKHGMTYPIVLGASNTAKMLSVPPVGGFPTTYLLNTEGRVVGAQAGPVTRASVETFMHCAVQSC